MQTHVWSRLATVWRSEAPRESKPKTPLLPDDLYKRLAPLRDRVDPANPQSVFSPSGPLAPFLV